MIIGVPKEIKDGEHRVGMVPSTVMELVKHDHTVLVQAGLGEAIGFDNQLYQKNGATIIETASEIFKKADLIVKVKELQSTEFPLLRQDQIVFTFLHLAPDLPQAEALMQSGCTAIGYETITDDFGGLPLLTPMSEVAGRISIQLGAHCLEKTQNGRGILLGGVPGVGRGSVVIIGAGVVGTNACRIAIGAQAQVTVLDNNLRRLRDLDQIYGSQIKTLYATATTIEHAVINADLVIGAVLVPGGVAPKLVTREMVNLMQKGAVLVDVAIDQGGCFETSKPTTFEDPTFLVDGVVHYCVTNIPGAVPRTSAFALNNATLPFIKKLANQGLQGALLSDPHFLKGLNIYRGQITHQAVAKALNKPFTDPEKALS